MDCSVDGRVFSSLNVVNKLKLSSYSCTLANFESNWMRKEWNNLELSGDIEFEQKHKSSILCMDVDQSECRYLLSVGVDCIVLYDMEFPINQRRFACKSIRQSTWLRKRGAVHSYAVTSVQWFVFAR